MSYEYGGGLEIPQVEYDQTLATVRERCNDWGYEDAEAEHHTNDPCEGRHARIRFERFHPFPLLSHMVIGVGNHTVADTAGQEVRAHELRSFRSIDLM